MHRNLDATGDLYKFENANEGTIVLSRGGTFKR